MHQVRYKYECKVKKMQLSDITSHSHVINSVFTYKIFVRNYLLS